MKAVRRDEDGLPAPHQPEVLEERRLQGLADAGTITRPGEWTWKVKGLGLLAGTAARLLDEVRGDRG